MYNVFILAGKDSGVEGGNSLKSISETQPEFQLLQIKNHCSHTLVEVTPEDELPGISRKCAVVLIL